jgi:ATP-binding cassette subfamily C protein CydD
MASPVDPRLLRLPALRGYLLAVALGGALSAVLVVVQASALATLVAVGVTGRLDRPALWTALVAIGLRAPHHAVSGRLAVRATARVKADLRGEVLAAATARGPVALSGSRAGELATLVGRGVDALDAYLAGYLPQLVLAVTVPLAVLIRLAFADLESTIIVTVTLPLIPIFAILVGWQTAARTQKQWRLLSMLGGHFLDMLRGLPTLRAFDRARAQVEVVRGMADRYRSATMATLRLAFLSALVLELVATLSVALVAVPVGLRLLSGSLTLPVALLVLLLAPEAYGPLRAAGAQFHASQEGVAVADDIFAALDAPASRAITEARVPDPATSAIVFDQVTAGYGGEPVLRDVDFRIEPGERLALTGPSGGGKSTILALLLGFVTVHSGQITVDGADLSTMDMDAWRARLAWVPQRPHLFATSVAGNIELGTPGAAPEAIREAARTAGALDFVDTLPQGFDTPLGERGYGLSSGERQRLALARAFLRTEAGLLLLDEPTARLDPDTEAAVLSASVALCAGRTAIFVAHRRALVAAATRVLQVAGGAVTATVTGSGAVTATVTGGGAVIATAAGGGAVIATAAGSGNAARTAAAAAVTETVTG